MKPTKKAPAPKTPAKPAAPRPAAPGPAAPKPAAPKPAAPDQAAASKTPMREWIALAGAHAKAKPGKSELPDYKIKALPEGTRLHAVLAEETGDHWRIKDGAIDGKKLPRNIKILEKTEWRLVPLDVEPAAAEPVQAEATAAPERAASPPPPEEASPAEPSPDDTFAYAPAAPAPLKLCLRGAGFLAPFLKGQFNVVVEGTSTYHSWGIFPVARAVAVHEEAASAAGRALLEKLPGMPPGRFTSEINTGGADVYVLSFATEIFAPLFRSRSTGMVLPLSAAFMKGLNSSNSGYAGIADKAAAAGITEEDWDYLQGEFEYVGLLNEKILADDLKTIFELLRGKTVIVLMLNTTAGNSQRLLMLYGKINALVRPLAETYGLETVETNDFVHGVEDLVQPDSNGATFKPEVYARIAARVSEMIGRHIPA